MATNYKIMPYGIPKEVMDSREKLAQRVRQNPLPDDELLRHLSVFILPQEIKRMLFFNEIYQQILDVPGVILEFGVRWGRNLSLLHAMRAIYEPYNYSRKIVGFDTFKGFPSVHEKDGKDASIQSGAYTVSENYEQFLADQLALLETQSPASNIQKFELVKGDASVTVHEWLKNNPASVVSFVYFDMDIYQPTFDALEALKPRLTKGSIVGFDEVSFEAMPGETKALMESFGLNNITLRRSQYSNIETYFVYAGPDSTSGY